MRKTTSPRPPRRRNPRRLERILGVIAITSLIAAWIVGATRADAALMPAVREAMPEADHFNQQNGGLYVAWADSDEQDLLGYVAIGTANGYGGPLKAAVAVNLQGEVVGMAVADHKETPSWMTRVLAGDLVESLIGKSHAEGFELDNDVDAVTGATYTSRAIVDAVLKGSRVGAEELGLLVTSPPSPKIQIGIVDVVLVSLFAVGYFAHKRGFKYKKHARWATMIVGMVVLGFWFNQPLTLSLVNRFLLGYWPQWQTNLYWYLLIGGMLFVFTVDNKNPYCEWFCPFGASQECLGAIGGAKIRSAGRYHSFLKWVQRGLAWAAIMAALLLRNPGVSSYEIFGTLFKLLGSNLEFLLLGMVLLAAMFVRRPWCNYLCPLAPVMDLYRTFRSWIKETWKNLGRMPAK